METSQGQLNPAVSQRTVFGSQDENIPAQRQLYFVGKKGGLDA